MRDRNRGWVLGSLRRRLVLTGTGLAVMAAMTCFLWVASASAQPACSDDYTGPSGGAWDTEANWTSPTSPSSHNVPTMTDVACVPSGTTVDVGSNEGGAAESIQGGGNLTMSGVEPHIGELSLFGPETSNIGDLTLNGGVLGGDSISMSGNFDWDVASGDDSIVDVVNGITQSGGGSFTISGSGTATDGGGAITTTSPVSISNVTGLSSSSSDGTNPSLTTTGVVTLAAGNYTDGIPVIAGGLDTTASTTYPNLLSVTGAGSDLAGSLSLPGATLTANAGSSLVVPTGVDLSAGAALISGTITGAGTYTTGGGGTFVESGGKLSTADVEIPTGSLIIESGGDYAAGDGAGTGTTISGGTLSSDSGATASTVDLTFSTGELNGGGALTISGEFVWTGGTVSDTAPISLTQTGGGSFSISGSGEPEIDGGSIGTASPVSITNHNLVGNDSSGAATLTTSNVVTLASGSYPGSGVSGSLAIVAAGFDLSGTTELRPISLVQTGGTTDVPVGKTLTTAGTFSLQGGVLQLDGRLAAAFAGATPESLSLTGGTLEGSGSVDESVTNTSGTVSPGDAHGTTLTLDEGYTQGSGATLAIAVDGAGTGDFSVLSVEGEVALDGVLALQPSAAYAASAAPGDTIAFLPYKRLLTGTFASTTVTPPLQAGESFAAAYGNASVVDAVVGAAQPPSSSGLPVISGSDQQGEVLSTTNGQWTNSPSSFTYQWEDCTTNSTSSCTAIPGAVSSSYTLAVGDVGDYVTVVVTAHDAAPSTGSATATPQGPVTAPAPSHTSAPANTGSTTVGGSGGVEVPGTISESGLLAIAGEVKVSRKGVAAVSVSCSGATGATCVGRLTLTANVKTKVKHKVKGHLKTVIKTKTLMLGSTSYSLAAGDSTTLSIKLSKSGVKLLEAAPGHKLKAVASALPSSGVTVTQTVTLVGAFVKKHKK